MELTILPEFSRKVKRYRAIIISAGVENSETSRVQKEEMAAMAAGISARYTLPDINRHPAVAATRAAYKACGKDPNRYRPSQEQLMRRIVRGLGLYHVNALVDAGNQLSLATGCSVGVFDADKIVGPDITLGVGHVGEPYEGIGRGPLNIAGLPVFRDAEGGFGTPTSDNERTKTDLATKRILVTIHLFDPDTDSDEVMKIFTGLFTRHVHACAVSHRIYTVPAAP